MSRMKDLFGDIPYDELPRPAPAKAFDGKTYEPKRDHERLSGQLLRVFNAMKTGGWWTIPRLAEEVNGSPQAVSARIRDLRKEKYGGHIVIRESVSGGLFRYRLELRKDT